MPCHHPVPIRRRLRARRAPLLTGLAVVLAGQLLGTPAAHSDTGYAATAAPNPPSVVTLTTDGWDNQLTLEWAPPDPTAPPDTYQIGVFEGAGSSLHQVGASSCDAPCTSATIQATPRSLTSAVVFASNSAGQSAGGWSNAVTVPQPCSLACITVDTSNSRGALDHNSDGYLDVTGAADPHFLAPTQWRTNLLTLTQTSAQALQKLQRTSITEVLSDDWRAEHSNGGYAQMPWSDWPTYSVWVTGEVRRIEALGRQRGFHITYWEVQNEPFGGQYYSASDTPPASETVPAVEQQFLVAYQAIKAADPTALVAGPSLIAWEAAPGDLPGPNLDMRSFLDFAVANGISLGAVTFHANSFQALPGWYAADGRPAQPAEIDAEVATLRQMLADRPSLGQPAILVNEYGDPVTSQLPGWDVGRIAALEAAGVTGANRSCWQDCGPSLDGLLTGAGGQPTAAYWVYAFYASMAGASVPIESSYTGVTGVASDRARLVSLLIGRHENCTPAEGTNCPHLAAQPLTVRVRVPWASSARVTAAVVDGGSDPSGPAAPSALSGSTVSVSGGWATFSTPALADGDAVEVTIRPAAVPTRGRLLALATISACSPIWPIARLCHFVP